MIQVTRIQEIKQNEVERDKKTPVIEVLENNFWESFVTQLFGRVKEKQWKSCGCS